MHCVKLLRLTCSVDAYDAPTFIGLHRPINILQERLCSTRNGNIVESKSGTFCISYDCSVSFEMIKEWVRVDEYIPNFSCIPTAHIRWYCMKRRTNLSSVSAGGASATDENNLLSDTGFMLPLDKTVPTVGREKDDAS